MKKIITILLIIFAILIIGLFLPILISSEMPIVLIMIISLITIGSFFITITNLINYFFTKGRKNETKNSCSKGLNRQN